MTQAIQDAKKALNGEQRLNDAQTKRTKPLTIHSNINLMKLTKLMRLTSQKHKLKAAEDAAKKRIQILIMRILTKLFKPLKMMAQ